MNKQSKLFKKMAKRESSLDVHKPRKQWTWFYASKGQLHQKHKNNQTIKKKNGQKAWMGTSVGKSVKRSSTALVTREIPSWHYVHAKQQYGRLCAYILRAHHLVKLKHMHHETCSRVFRTYLLVQWLGICLPMQGTQVWSLVQGDSMCYRATKPTYHNWWAQQGLRAATTEPIRRKAMLHRKRSHCSEKLMHHKEWPCLPQLEKACTQQLISSVARNNKYFKKNVHSSSVCDSSKLETNQMPTNTNKIDNLWCSLSKYSENKYMYHQHEWLRNILGKKGKSHNKYCMAPFM